jgi:hypothetical protein
MVFGHDATTPRRHDATTLEELQAQAFSCD